MNTLDFILAYENGELDREEIVAGFQCLIDSGAIDYLQGFYQRQALELLKSGECSLRGAPNLLPHA
jgi:hypothetical protein